MNINELMKDLYDVVKQSGWLDKATEYFQEHPEKFSNCVSGIGVIANITMSVSYQPESLSAHQAFVITLFLSYTAASFPDFTRFI